MKTIRTLLAVTTAGILFLNLGLTGCKKETVERTGAEQQIDQQLAEQVKAAFGNSPSFKFPDVQVASFKGKVQLSGFVRSEDQKSSAETIAKGIPGVVEVENQISLKQ
ncbi:MAG: BON domain-containing protein [Verrucomicrobiota bacterium]|nr:BON domain-containing protein [Verrucomicrobiota bacterium]